MKNQYTFLRHAETIKDPSKPAPEWDLTSEALDKINQHISQSKFDKISKIYSSTESKAVATGKPILEYLQSKLPNIKISDLGIYELEEFVEIKREKKFLTDTEFHDQKKRELTNLNQIENGVESANTALIRFEAGIQKLEEKYADVGNPENILIITHGTVLALYLSKMESDMKNVFSQWQKLQFCELIELPNN